MASPEIFARRIRRRARQVESGASDAVKSAALVINQVVILETPVKTGHARANWQIGLVAPITKEIDAEDIDGAATIARNNTLIRAREKRVDIILSNNVPYINELNEGSSSQAPAGFVQLAVLAAVAVLAKTRVFK
jgi:hypothetical protein